MAPFVSSSIRFQRPRLQMAHGKRHPTPGPASGDWSETGPGCIIDVASVLRESLVIIDMKELEIWSRYANACMRDDRPLGQT
jgi:hypothetical protein